MEPEGDGKGGPARGAAGAGVVRPGGPLKSEIQKTLVPPNAQS
jgi:hypothetical protein